MNYSVEMLISGCLVIVDIEYRIDPAKCHVGPNVSPGFEVEKIEVTDSFYLSRDESNWTDSEWLDIQANLRDIKLAIERGACDSEAEGILYDNVELN